jgi:putative ABC transport system substrate-binding protein
LPTVRLLRQAVNACPPLARAPLLAILLIALPCAADPSRVAVVYPELPAPYDKVFDTIVGGMRRNSDLTVAPLPLKQDQRAASVQEWLAGQAVRTVVALGPKGCQVARQAVAGGGPPLLCGATVVGSDDGVGGVSLAVDPVILLERLHFLSPRTRRVHVVFDPGFNGWLMERARRSAARLGLELVGYEEDSLRGAVHRYRGLLDNGLSDQDALWLPLDPTTVTDDVVLPLVLKAAWEERITVFSSKPAHVRKGVLFSLYPDHAAMGRRLGRLALQADADRPILEPLKDVMLAVNRRTAAHLGLRFDPAQEGEFALVFPSR